MAASMGTIDTSRPEAGTAAVFTAPGQPLDLQTFPIPHLEAGEALVRIECCTLCGSDLHTFRGTRAEKSPSILGHEILGVVASVGSPPPMDIDGRELQQGDRIIWSVAVSCGDCDRCHRGLPQKCRSLAKYGHELAEGRFALSGGLAEYLLLRRGSAAIRVKSEISAHVICPASCATATVAAALRISESVAGKNVLIFGAGMLGLTAAAFAKTHSAAKVVVCDVDPERLELAKRFGATETLSDLDSIAASFNVVLEMSGSPDAVEAAFLSADVGAIIVLVGSVMKSRAVSFDPEQIVRRWTTIHGVHNYAPADLRTAAAFLERFGAEFPFAELISKTYPLSDVNAAFKEALHTRPIRIAVRP